MNTPKFDALCEEILKGGKADGMSVQDIADKWKVSTDEVEKQIAIGMKIEREHSSDKNVQREIACDHIAEFLHYYQSLEKMESSLED